MQKNWIYREIPDPVVVKQLEDALSVGKPVASLMVQRGLNSPEEADDFFSPKLGNLHDPRAMKDMYKAVERLSTAIDRNEKILIYGDYDVDGTTAVALVYSFLRKFHSNLDYYIPDRYSEGYGVSAKGIDYASQNNCNLMITLDCGIKAVEKAEYARSKGLDLIICDHHLPGEAIPDVVAVLDPKQPGCSYPYKELSGCGVGFKFIQAYAIVNDIPFTELIPYLDLVAVSIASDIVPITGENRVLAYFGLQQLNSNPRMGLSKIISSSEIRKTITIEDVVFKIGPKINAAGRMESGKKAVELLVSDDHAIATGISGEINDCNKERRSVDRSITTEALRMISNDPRHSETKTTVLFNPGWHKGVIGIVASRLIETHYRPTVILTESNGFATGSARSVAGYDLYQAIESCSDLLESFGGHMFAAGLTMKKENIPEFVSRFDKYVAGTITDDQLVPKVDIDLDISLADINETLFHQISRLQPFGPQNLAPVFVTRNVYDSGSGRIVGTGGEHLKLDLCSEESGTSRFSAIAFGVGNRFGMISEGKPVDIAYTIEMNEYKNLRNLQLNIKDIKPSVKS